MNKAEQYFTEGGKRKHNDCFNCFAYYFDGKRQKSICKKGYKLRDWYAEKSILDHNIDYSFGSFRIIHKTGEAIICPDFVLRNSNARGTNYLKGQSIKSLIHKYQIEEEEIWGEDG